MAKKDVADILGLPKDYNKADETVKVVKPGIDQRLNYAKWYWTDGAFRWYKILTNVRTGPFNDQIHGIVISPVGSWETYCLRVWRITKDHEKFDRAQRRFVNIGEYLQIKFVPVGQKFDDRHITVQHAGKQLNDNGWWICDSTRKTIPIQESIPGGGRQTVEYDMSSFMRPLPDDWVDMLIDSREKITNRNPKEMQDEARKIIGPTLDLKAKQ